MALQVAPFLVFIQVEHDGNLSPDELASALGMAINDHPLEVTAISAEGAMGTFKIGNCLGVYSGVLGSQMKDPH